MTLNQLKAAVARLGFERELEDDEALKISANRALRLIFSERPVRKAVLLPVGSLPVCSRVAAIEHIGGKTDEAQLCGRCYSFRAYGKGSYTVKDKDGAKKGSFDGHGVAVKGFISSDATIFFEGENFYKIYELCSFEYAPSKIADDIPVKEPMQCIDVASTESDFLAFEGLPTDQYGNELKYAVLQDGRVYLPWDFKGEIRLEYRRTPTPILLSRDAEIDLPRECEELLPLLTASFLWLDDDGEKAQYYMALYKDALATLKRYSNSGIDCSYRTNGWA